jgi:hypothetical protein
MPHKLARHCGSSRRLTVSLSPSLSYPFKNHSPYSSLQDTPIWVYTMSVFLPHLQIHANESPDKSLHIMHRLSHLEVDFLCITVKVYSIIQMGIKNLVYRRSILGSFSDVFNPIKFHRNDSTNTTRHCFNAHRSSSRVFVSFLPFRRLSTFRFGLNTSGRVAFQVFEGLIPPTSFQTHNNPVGL